MLPPQLDDSEMRCACAEVVEDIGANGLRDVGRAMAALKQRYPGKMDFGPGQLRREGPPALRSRPAGYGRRSLPACCRTAPALSTL